MSSTNETTEKAASPITRRKDFFLKFSHRPSNSSDCSPIFDKRFNSHDEAQIKESGDNTQTNASQRKPYSTQHLQKENQSKKRMEARYSTQTPTFRREPTNFTEQVEEQKSRSFSQRMNLQKLQSVYNLSKESMNQMVAKRQRQQIIPNINIVNINDEEHQEVNQFCQNSIINTLFILNNKRINIILHCFIKIITKIVIQILQDKNKTMKDIAFLKKAISNLPLFQKNPDLLNKQNTTQTLLNEFSYEKFKKHDVIFNFGSVYLLIPKTNKDDNREEKDKVIKKKGDQKANPSTVIQSNVSISSQLVTKTKITELNIGSTKLLIQPSKENIQTNPSIEKETTEQTSKWGLIKSNIKNLRIQTISNTIHKQNSIENHTQQNQEEEEEVEEEEQEDEADYLKRLYDDMNLIKTFVAGEAFGEIALITKQRRTGTMVCKEDTHLMTLTKNGFDKILGKYHEQIKTERLGFLKSYTFFKNIPNSKLLSILLDTKIETLPKRAQLFTQGEERGEVQLSKVIYENATAEENTDQSLNDSNNSNKAKSVQTKEDLFNKYHNRSRQKTVKMQQSHSHVGGEDLTEHILNNLTQNIISKLTFFHSCTAEIVSQDAEIYKLNKQHYYEQQQNDKINIFLCKIQQIFLNNIYLFKSIEDFGEQLKEKVQYIDKRLEEVVKVQDKTVRSMRTLLKQIDNKKNKEEQQIINQEYKVDSPKSSKSNNQNNLNSSYYDTMSNHNTNSPSSNKSVHFFKQYDRDQLLEETNTPRSLNKSIETKFYKNIIDFKFDNDLSPNYINNQNLAKQEQKFSNYMLEQLQQLPLQKRPTSQFSQHTQKSKHISIENSPIQQPEQLRQRLASVQGERNQHVIQDNIHKSSKEQIKIPIIKLKNPQNNQQSPKLIIQRPKKDSAYLNTLQLEDVNLPKQSIQPSLLLSDIYPLERSNSKKLSINEGLLNINGGLTELQQSKNTQSYLSFNSNNSNNILQTQLKQKPSELDLVSPSSIEITLKSNRSSQLGFKEYINRSKSTLNLKLKLPQIQKNILNFQDLSNRQSLLELNTSTVQTDRANKNQSTERTSRTCQYSYCSSNRDKTQSSEEGLLYNETQQVLPLHNDNQSNRHNYHHHLQDDPSTQTLRKYDEIPLEIQQIIDQDSSLFRSQIASQIIKNSSRSKFKLDFQQELKYKRKMLKKSLNSNQYDSNNLKSTFPIKGIDNIQDLNVDLFGEPSKYHSIILMQQLMHMELRNSQVISQKNEQNENTPSTQKEEQKNYEKDRDKHLLNFKQSAQIPIQSNRLQSNLIKFLSQKLQNQSNPNNENNKQAFLMQEANEQAGFSPLNLKAVLLSQKNEREKRNLREVESIKLNRSVSPPLPKINVSISAPVFDKVKNDSPSMSSILSKIMKQQLQNKSEVANIHTLNAKKNINLSYHNGLAKMIPSNSSSNLLKKKLNDKLETSGRSNQNLTPRADMSLIK